ncbi:hypothetical protein AQUSIP_23190 [Aquicella siphonis]|uniref:SnoaL-like domain-containing protein n=1 Tax=Aquicella siphonis TaxID=254247 RepID=A0A5E4PL48_9COXI|nr:nuclear transport factor 2 family protein [Aquicella siphonis]VVC76992.1 hypothetical protein AQUSIP_23190 [Aquicella siphonis]
MPWAHLREVIKKYISAYNHFDIDGMMECFADECVFAAISGGSCSISCQGKSQVRELAAQSAMYFLDRKQQVKNWILSDNQAAIEIQYRATLKKDLPNGLKAGEELNLLGVSVFRFENDKIIELRDYN